MVESSTTRGGGTTVVEATADELVLDAAPDAAPRARRFTAELLAGEPSGVIEDAELIVTELVTNAVLHGRPPVTVRVTQSSGRIRLEVQDGGSELPVRAIGGGEAMTGRGLGMVAALALRWGIDRSEGGGKIVWAELREAGTTVTDTQPEVDIDRLLDAWADELPSVPVFTVELGAVPTDLLLGAKAHIDNLVREFTLATSAAAAPGGEKLPAELARLVQTVVHSFVDARSQIKRQAIAAAERGLPETHLTLRLPASAADAGEQYLSALDDADRHARAARLLTLETPPVHKVFRRWYVETLVGHLRRQAIGLKPLPAVTFPQRLGEEFAALVPLQELAERLALLQKVTADLTGARAVEDVVHAVVVNAIESIGAHSVVIYLLGDDGMLRSAASGGGGDARLAQQYDEFPASADLPGGEALRTGQPLFLRDLAALAERFPALAGVYPDERTLLVAPLIVGEHQLGVLALTFRGPGRFDDETQLAFISTLADVTAQALERASAATAAGKAAERLAFLAEASVVLSSSVDYRTVLQAVADLVVPQLADWCVIQLLDDDVLQTVALTHFDPSKTAWAKAMEGRYPTDMESPTGAPSVLRTGVSELYAEIPQEMLAAAAVDEEHLQLLTELGMSSALVVPLPARSGPIGVITMIYAESGRRFAPEDVAFAEDLARRAALAVETAHAFREQSGRLAEVTRVAEAAQHAILAAPPPQIGPIALAARYVSAAAEALIGGDLYEVVERPGAVRLLIGDVRGKGLEAVRTATIVLGEFRSAAADIDDFVEVATQIDRRVRRYLGDEDFVTALLAEVKVDGSFAIANCGHPPALLASATRVVEVESENSLPLGLGAAPTLATGQMSAGDRLLLYTDGIIEARDSDRRFIDMMSIVEPLMTGELEAVLDRILDALRESVGGALGDDLALLVAEFRG